MKVEINHHFVHFVFPILPTHNIVHFCSTRCRL